MSESAQDLPPESPEIPLPANMNFEGNARPRPLIPTPSDHTPLNSESDDPLPVIRASEFANLEVPPRDWLVPELLPHRSVTMLSGDGGVGKSLLALQLAVAVAAGKDWIGTIPERGPVVYVSAEDEREEIHRRLAAITEGLEVPFSALDDLRIVPLAGRDAVMGTPNPTNGITGTTLWKSLVAEVDQILPRLLILDNLADVFAGNENSRPGARQFIGLLRRLAIKTELAVLLLAHPSLTGINSGSGSSGSTAWNNSVRSRLYLQSPKDSRGEQADQDLRILSAKKANYSGGNGEIRLRWSKGRFVLDGPGVGGLDRRVAEERADRKFLDLLAQFEREGRDVSPNPSAVFAPKLFAEHPDAGGIPFKALRAAMDRLLADGRVKVVELGPPSKRRKRLILASE